MTSGWWALVSGVVAVAAVLILLWPVDCVGVAEGGMDPHAFSKECATPLGFHVSWPYDPVRVEDGHSGFRPGEVPPNWPPLVFTAAVVGVVAAGSTYLAAEWRRDRFDRLLSYRPARGKADRL